MKQLALALVLAWVTWAPMAQASSTQSAAENAALIQPAFTAPITLNIGPDATAQLPRIEVKKGYYHKGPFTQAITNDFPPCVLDHKDYISGMGLGQEINVSLNGLSVAPREAMQWLLQNEVLHVKEFKLFNYVAGTEQWRQHAFYCPLLNMEAIEKMRKDAPQAVIDASSNGARIMVAKRVFDRWTYQNTYTTPFPAKGDVKVFAGTFAYKIESLTQSALRLASQGMGSWRVKMYFDPDHGRWTMLESENTSPTVELIGTGAPRIIQAEPSTQTSSSAIPPRIEAAPARPQTPAPSGPKQTVADIQARCEHARDTEATGEGEFYPGKNNAVWRCMNRSVYVCELGASGRACMKLDLSKSPHEGIRSFCRESPNADNVPNAMLGSSAYAWRCRAGNPVIAGEPPRVDERGYWKDGWRKASAALTAGKTGERSATTERLPIRDGRYARVDVPCNDAPMSASNVISGGIPLYSPQYGECRSLITKTSNQIFKVSANCKYGSSDDPPATVYTLVGDAEYMFQNKIGAARMRWCGAK